MLYCSNLSYSSRNPHACLIHPGVSALGKKYTTNFFPLKSPRFLIAPSWSGRENSGASLPMIGSAVNIEAIMESNSTFILICEAFSII